jgi:hypothetical protein
MPLTDVRLQEQLALLGGHETEKQMGVLADDEDGQEPHALAGGGQAVVAAQGNGGS